MNNNINILILKSNNQVTSKQHVTHFSGNRALLNNLIFINNLINLLPNLFPNVTFLCDNFSATISCA